MGIPTRQVKDVVNKANELFVQQVTPYIKEQVALQIKEKVKPECLKEGI